MKEGTTHNPNIDFSQVNVERFYATLVKIIEAKEGVKITYRLERRSDYDGV